MCIFEIAGNEGSEALLSSCIPELQAIAPPSMGQIFCEEVNTYGGLNVRGYTLAVSSKRSWMQRSMMLDLPTFWLPRRTAFSLVLPETVLIEWFIQQQTMCISLTRSIPKYKQDLQPHLQIQIELQEGGENLDISSRNDRNYNSFPVSFITSNKDQLRYLIVLPIHSFQHPSVIKQMNKQFDDFSFKARDSQSESQKSISFAPPPPPPPPLQYRHLQSTPPPPINDRIRRIDQELEENIRRRMQLQEQLRGTQRSQEADNLEKESRQEKEAKNFKKLQQRGERIELVLEREKKRISSGTQFNSSDKDYEILRNKHILSKVEPLPIMREQILIPLPTEVPIRRKQPQVYTLPDQARIQQLLRRTTFPQLPTANLPTLLKQGEQLWAIHAPHSDIHYCLMVIYYHMEKYNQVRQHYAIILNFRNFNPQAHWVAAEAEFALQQYQICLRLTEDCLQHLPETLLPRFLFLKARSYLQLGELINSAVCWGQLIKVKPTTGEYYLQRGLIYERIGYFPEAKQDFVAFATYCPQAHDVLRDKILSEKNQARRQQLLAVLSKLS